MASASHLEETFFGIAPHLNSLHRERRCKNPFIMTTTSVSWEPSDVWRALVYLLAHADLHDGVVNECFPQVFVLLLLEALYVHPRPFNMLPARTHKTQVRNLKAASTHREPAPNAVYDSLALGRLLLHCLFALCYQLLQQLQPGLPLLRCLLSKQLVGHTFEGECPHYLRKCPHRKDYSQVTRPRPISLWHVIKFSHGSLRVKTDWECNHSGGVVWCTPVASSSRWCFLEMRSWEATSSSNWVSSCFLHTALPKQRVQQYIMICLLPGIWPLNNPAIYIFRLYHDTQYI